MLVGWRLFCGLLVFWSVGTRCLVWWRLFLGLLVPTYVCLLARVFLLVGACLLLVLERICLFVCWLILVWSVGAYVLGLLAIMCWFVGVCLGSLPRVCRFVDAYVLVRCRLLCVLLALMLWIGSVYFLVC